MEKSIKKAYIKCSIKEFGNIFKATPLFRKRKGWERGRQKMGKKKRQKEEKGKLGIPIIGREPTKRETFQPKRFGGKRVTLNRNWTLKGPKSWS